MSVKNGAGCVKCGTEKTVKNPNIHLCEDCFKRVEGGEVFGPPLSLKDLVTLEGWRENQFAGAPS